MRKEFSVYLDALRLTAAMAVVASHFTYPQFITSAPYPAVVGRLAVAWFFVLSGYVIAYVSSEKEKNLGEYVVSRAARIYSVAIPAILITLAIDFYLMGQGASGDLPLYEYKSLWKYLPLFLTFGGEIAGNHVQVFSDGPFWSLSYEVWYYVAFAIFVYLRGALRLALGIALIPILGLPALLYFPIWILGGLVYRAHQRISLSPTAGSLGAVFTSLIFVTLLVLGYFEGAERYVNRLFHNWPVEHLHYSMNFPSFYIAGLLAASNLFFAGYCRLNILSGHRTKKLISYLASFTFAIYLAHRPLMNFWAAFTHHDPHSVASIFSLVGLTLASCWCFGLVSETKKSAWRSLFGLILDMGRRQIAERSIPAT